MVCRLSLFGPPRLLDDQGRLISVPVKTYALVAYLLLASCGGPATRASLRQFLWEDGDAKTAATNLRKFLSRLLERQAECGCELILSRRDHVELATESIRVDLAEFLRIVGQRLPADLTALCDLYRGDLLQGCEFEGTDVQFWLNLQRGRLRDTFIAAVAGRLEPLDADADKVAVRIAARRLLEVDPYNEVGHRALMRLFAEDSEPARVKDLYQSLEARLQEDLGVAPDEVTTKLLRTLLPAARKGDAAAPSRSENAPAVAASVTPAPTDDELASDDTTVVPERSGAPRITVLPPLPIGGQDYDHQLAVSLIEDVTIGLCRSKALSVVAPHTAWALSQRKTLLRKYRIDYAVETHLQNRGGDPWLGLRLLDPLSRQILWTEQYSLSQEQVAHQYRAMSVRILSSLIEKIERAELSRYDNEQNASAYHLYLVGQRHLRTLDLPHVRRARRAFKNALGACPDFVPTLSGLAKTLRLEWILLARGDPDLLVEAGRLARRSLEIDPDDARGHRESGVCQLYSGRFDESLRSFEQAERCNPQYADLLVDFADALTHACEPSTGLQKVSEAIELNPLCPDYYWWVAGGSNFHLHRYDDAINCVSRMRDQTPAYRLLAASFARLGQGEQAAEYVRKVKEIHPDFSVSNWLSILPIRDPQYERDYEDGLRQAGFD
jgi:DNA-binding SARP family transcriptional activator/tetratricopeptide (TPR) repeat protein